jgi:hypothetical protein
MRLVQHLAVHLHDAGRIALECRDDPFRPGDFLFRRHEGGIDDVDVFGMDHGLGEKTVLARRDRLLPQRIEVVDVGRDGVDSDDAGGRRGNQAEIARQPERTVKAAVGAVARGAERGCKVLGAPHHAPQPRAHILDIEQFRHCPRRLGRDRDDACGALLNAGCRLEGIEV